MKKRNNFVSIESNKKKSKRVKWVVIGACVSLLLLPIIAMGLLKLIAVILNANPGWNSPLYKFHHPALYQCQRDWLKFGDNIIRGEYFELYSVKDGKEYKIDFGYSFFDYCISDDVLYTIDFNGVYAYNSKFEEIERYDIKTSSGYRGCFIVKGDYIFHEDKHDIYKYSMISRQDEYLFHADINRYLPSEKIGYRKITNGTYKFVDLEKENYSYPGYSHPDYNYYYEIYNEKYGVTYINDCDNKLTINNKTFEVDGTVRLGDMVYSNSDCLILYTYNPCCDDCYFRENCISQLKEVKLWKYDFQKETLSLIKEFNDYTILIAFDETNYHYYYDGKLYSNDIVIEELSFKLEVGNLFNYYAYNEPNFNRPGVAISKTSFSYIDGKFYYVHTDYPENNEVTQVKY